jgi:hypothetical protein
MTNQTPSKKPQHKSTKRSCKPKSTTRPSKSKSTVLYHLGFAYTHGWTSTKKRVYRCSVYRRTACKARLVIRPDVFGYELVNEHICRHSIDSDDEVVDVTREMKTFVDSLAVSNLSVPSMEVWAEVSATFYPADGVIRRGLTEEQVVSRVYRVRRKHYGGHMLGMIEVPPLSMVEDKNLNFLQFHISRPNEDPFKRPDRVIGWAHPELRSKMMYNSVSLFIDGTFRCVPVEFKQCVIVMVYDRVSELFVPVYFVLCTGKTSDMYFDILELIYRDCSEKLEPSDIVCDFELPLINAAQKQFENAEIVGCLFHFKQAVRRQMKSTYHIAEKEVSIAMERGVLDMLTVIEPSTVARQGVKWVKNKIRSRCEEEGIDYSTGKWARFWRYFRATWLGRYAIEEWNVHGLENYLVARTNNPLERFHRELNKAFPTPHPNLVAFVTVIRKISQQYVAKLDNIATGRRKPNTKKNAKTTNKGKKSTSLDKERVSLPEPVDLLDYDAASESEGEDTSGEIDGDDSSDSEAPSDKDGLSTPFASDGLMSDESESESMHDFSYEPDIADDSDADDASDDVYGAPVRTVAV